MSTASTEDRGLVPRTCRRRVSSDRRVTTQEHGEWDRGTKETRGDTSVNRVTEDLPYPRPLQTSWIRSVERGSSSPLQVGPTLLLNVGPRVTTSRPNPGPLPRRATKTLATSRPNPGLPRRATKTLTTSRPNPGPLPRRVTKTSTTSRPQSWTSSSTGDEDLSRVPGRTVSLCPAVTRPVTLLRVTACVHYYGSPVDGSYPVCRGFGGWTTFLLFSFLLCYKVILPLNKDLVDPNTRLY